MRALPLLLGCLTALAGCSPDPPAQVGPTPSPQASTSVHAGASPAAASPAAPTTKRTARDGEGLAPCSDGTCQVLLRGNAQLTPARKFRIDQIFLKFTAPNRVDFTVIRRIGNIQGYVKGTGYLSLAGTITIRIEHVNADGAVLRFEPTSTDPTQDEGRGTDGLSLYSI